MNASRILLSVLCALSISACYPVFKDVPDTPLLTGIVTRHGKPATGAIIRFYQQDPILSDEVRIARQRADGSGRFTIGPITRFRYFEGWTDNKGTDWRLELVVDGKPYQGWQNMALGKPSGRIDVACELDDPVRYGKLGLHSEGEGLCRMLSEKE